MKIKKTQTQLNLGFFLITAFLLSEKYTVYRIA